MAKPQPNINEEGLAGVVEGALREFFADEHKRKAYLRAIENSVPSDSFQVECLLRNAGVYERLEEHIRREIQEPSLKGPDMTWKLRRILGRA